MDLFGRGSGAEQQQFLCFLFLNNVNEKVFVLAWFWLLFLGTMAASKVLFRLATAALIPGGLSGARLRAACRGRRRTLSDVADMGEPSMAREMGKVIFRKKKLYNCTNSVQAVEPLKLHIAAPFISQVIFFTKS